MVTNHEPQTTVAMTAIQREANERLQAQRAYRKRKVPLQHAYGMPIRARKETQK